MHIRLNIAILLGLVVGAFLAVGLTGAAWSSSTPVIPGSPCSNVGQVGTHGGQTYRCEKRLGEVCESWHWAYSGSVPKSGRTAWPHPSCPCVSASATPTPSTTPAVSLSTSPAYTSSPQPVHSTAIAVVPVPNASTSPLPVTGSPVVGLGALGGALVATGGLILLAVRIRRTARL